MDKQQCNISPADDTKEREHLWAHLSDDRLKQLVWEVWCRIPEHDRQPLLTLRLVVLEDNDLVSDGRKRAGQCKLEYTPQDEWVCSVRLATGVEPDDVYRQIIAHEFAHAALRHPWLIQFTQVYHDPLDVEFASVFPRVLNTHADLQVVLWGFVSETIVSARIDPRNVSPTALAAAKTMMATGKEARNGTDGE